MAGGKGAAVRRGSGCLSVVTRLALSRLSKSASLGVHAGGLDPVVVCVAGYHYCGTCGTIIIVVVLL